MHAKDVGTVGHFSGSLGNWSSSGDLHICKEIEASENCEYLTFSGSWDKAGHRVC
jgi:hypothetical protein